MRSNFTVLHLLAPVSLFAIVAAAAPPAPVAAQAGGPLDARIEQAVEAVTPRVVEWRRDIHQHPELGNREFRTAALVAEHLRSLGIDVETGVAHTGVVGVLRGGRPGPVVALRADMDALPVTEMVDLPFASKETAMWAGREVGVMHACGHDNHVAILMGAAEVLAGMREDLPGTVKFIFQPAEEGPPPGEEGGARLMVEEGVLSNPAPGAIFGLHVWPAPVGTISYKPEGTMASADAFRIVVRGRQTHGSAPWSGVDPIVVSAQIINGLQTIASRQVDVTKAPSVVTVGSINGGLRWNIIPDSVVMEGTIRALDTPMQEDIHQRLVRTAEMIAESGGATAEVTITRYAPVTYNDPGLTAAMAGTLERVAGAERVSVMRPITGAEDFAYYAREIPAFFFFLGVTPEGQDPAEAAVNHSPYFFADEAALPLGVRTMTQVAVDYLAGAGTVAGRSPE
ncbi:MAG: amidohydrolase [Longimicrobiaceae bacterium]